MWVVSWIIWSNHFFIIYENMLFQRDTFLWMYHTRWCLRWLQGTDQTHELLYGWYLEGLKCSFIYCTTNGKYVSITLFVTLSINLRLTWEYWWHCYKLWKHKMQTQTNTFTHENLRWVIWTVQLGSLEKWRNFRLW